MTAIFECSQNIRFSAAKKKYFFELESIAFKLQDAKCLDYSSRAVRNTA